MTAPIGWLALSMRQPWLFAVLAAAKRVENRERRTGHRGPFILHASSSAEDGYYRDAVHWMRERGLVRPRKGPAVHKALAALPEVPALDTLPRGGYCGIAELVTVLPPGHHFGRVLELVPTLEGPRQVDTRWHMPNHYGYVLDGVRDLPLVPARGWPGWWEVSPADVVRLGLPPTPAEYVRQRLAAKGAAHVSP